MKTNFRQMEKTFTNYAKTFGLKVPKINGKWLHTFRVVKNAEKIAKSLQLSKEDVYLAKVIALFHDLGRFEQWTNYHTFSDHKSEDHAVIATRVLFEKNQIAKYNVDEKYHKIIKLAVLNHNKKDINLDEFKLENGEIDEQALLHAKIIRDADKLDIFYAFRFKGYIDVYNTANEVVSPEVLKEFNNYTNITNKYVRNNIDRSLNLLGMVFDLYFPYSFRKTLKLKYHENIIQHYSLFLSKENYTLLNECANKALEFMKEKANIKKKNKNTY